MDRGRRGGSHRLTWLAGGGNAMNMDTSIPYSDAGHFRSRSRARCCSCSSPPRSRNPRVRAGHFVAGLLPVPAFAGALPPQRQSASSYEIDKVWINHPNIHYHMGMDGISMWLVVLTTFLTPLCVLISWNSIHDRVKEFFILLLVLETAMIGVFLALDLFLFYFFWEATLIPMALLIGMYGHGRKVYAAVKFFLYTMVASVFMLAAILWLYAQRRKL